MKITESNFDTFAVERAFIDADGQPRAIVSGVLCNIETKPAPLMDGIAWCVPVDGIHARDWPIYVKAVKDGCERTFPNATTQPRIVAAARRWLELAAADQLTPNTEL